MDVIPLTSNCEQSRVNIMPGFAIKNAMRIIENLSTRTGMINQPKYREHEMKNDTIKNLMDILEPLAQKHALELINKLASIQVKLDNLDCNIPAAAGICASLISASIINSIIKGQEEKFSLNEHIHRFSMMIKEQIENAS